MTMAVSRFDVSDNFWWKITDLDRPRVAFHSCEPATHDRFVASALNETVESCPICQIAQRHIGDEPAGRVLED